MMTLVNEFNKKEKISAADYLVFVKLLSPFAPHLGEELWADLGGVGSILMAPWPKFDHELVQDSEITLAVQVNGKLRDTLSVSSDIDENTVRKLALESEKVQKWLSGRAPEKVIYVKGKLISIVV
jgi:leucyl-tRNA synthetase